MSTKFKNLAGTRFGRLLALRRDAPSRLGYWWMCHCDCGKTKKVLITRLLNGTTKSCGCYSRELSTKRIRRVKNSRPLADRFWEKVDKTPGLGPTGECWEWRGCRTPEGYGKIYVNGRPVFAHRVAWKLRTGSFSKKHVLHDCDYPPCVRHLHEGTHSQNMIEAWQRSRRKGHAS
jgi:hypothetical protein